MRISLKSDSSKTYFVYGIYWAIHISQFQRFHNVIVPEDGFGGFSPLVECEINVIDPNMDHYFIRKDSNGNDMIIHKAAYPSEEFFFALVDHGHMEKVKELQQRMRLMGLNPS